MFPKQFDYYEASSVEEAFDLMEAHEDENAELLAGGHSLLPTMKTGLASPDALIDIGGIDELQGIEDEGDTTLIGALTHYADIADSQALHRHAPALADAASQVGDVQVRNRGTIGGNLAHADPASDLPGAAISADAKLVVQSRDGEREVPAGEFFLGMYATDIGPGELLTGVRVPHEDDAGGAYAKKPSPSSGYAMVGVAATVELDGDTVTSARIGANGAMDHGVRLDPVEDALVDGPATEEAAEDAGEHATDDLDVDFMMEDNQASADFRAQLLKVYAGRAVSAAFERAR